MNIELLFYLEDLSNDNFIFHTRSASVFNTTAYKMFQKRILALLYYYWKPTQQNSLF